MAAKLNTTDDSPMMTLGSTALHLQIADFKFTHNFIICDQLPDMELIFGIDIQKKFSLSYTWDKDKHCYMQRNGKFLAFTHANNHSHLCAGYHHIPLDKSSIPKTAFNLPFRKFEYVKDLFGLAQAPAYFQELMTGILKDFPFAIAYLDNIIIFSKTPQEHLSHICMVFKKLKSANLSMKESKCSFFSKEIQYLGHILSATGI